MIRILIVDDHAAVRHGLEQLLHSAGDMTVVGQAADGLEALEMSEQLRPDIVLMDITMPRMDGLRACELLRRRNLGVKVILLSALTDEVLTRAASLVGAKGILSKTASATLVLDTIRAVCEEGRRAD